MADELIRLDTTIIGIDSLINKASTAEEAKVLFTVKDVIYSQQRYVSDVQSVKRGRWIDCTFYDPCEKSWEQDFEFECSNCGHKIYNKPNDNNLFCGHCSARMDRGADNENNI